MPPPARPTSRRRSAYRQGQSLRWAAPATAAAAATRCAPSNPRAGDRRRLRRDQERLSRLAKATIPREARRQGILAFPDDSRPPTMVRGARRSGGPASRPDTSIQFATTGLLPTKIWDRAFHSHGAIDRRRARHEDRVMTPNPVSALTDRRRPAALFAQAGPAARSARLSNGRRTGSRAARTKGCGDNRRHRPAPAARRRIQTSAPKSPSSRATSAPYGASSVTDLLTQPRRRPEAARAGARAPVVLLKRPPHLGLREIQESRRGDPAGRDPAGGGGAALRLHGRPEGGEYRPCGVLPGHHRRSSAGTSTRAAARAAAARPACLRIRRDTRLNLDVKYQASDSLLGESARHHLRRAPRPTPSAAMSAPLRPARRRDRSSAERARRAPVTIAACRRPPHFVRISPAMRTGQCQRRRPYRTFAAATDQLPAQRGAGPADRQRLGDVQRQLQATRGDSLTGVPGVTLIVPAGDPSRPSAPRRARPLCPGGAPDPERRQRAAHVRNHIARHAPSLELALTGQLRPGGDAHGTVSGLDISSQARSNADIPASIRSVEPGSLPARCGSPAIRCPTPAMCSSSPTAP